MDTLNIKIGRRLRTIRHLSKKTQREIALEFETTKSTISKYERGELAVTPDTINKYCALFQIEHAWLLTGKGEPTRKESEVGFLELFAQLPRKKMEAIEQIIKVLSD